MVYLYRTYATNAASPFLADGGRKKQTSPLNFFRLDEIQNSIFNIFIPVIATSKNLNHRISLLMFPKWTRTIADFMALQTHNLYQYIPNYSQ